MKSSVMQCNIIMIIDDVLYFRHICVRVYFFIYATSFFILTVVVDSCFVQNRNDGQMSCSKVKMCETCVQNSFECKREVIGRNPTLAAQDGPTTDASRP